MYNRRYTPERISSLRENEIFVFGSNLAGVHAGGAARTARLKFGAIKGQGVGLQGQSYAIPTMQGGPETVRPYVDEFITFAKQHPELTFYVTRIGCGIAGFRDIDIAPVFINAIDVENILLPETFVRALKKIIITSKMKKEVGEIIAEAWNTLNADKLIGLLKEDFVYGSMGVDKTLDGKAAYAEYITGKFQNLKDNGIQCHAEYIENVRQQVLIITDNSPKAIMEYEVEDGLIKSMFMHPQRVLMVNDLQDESISIEVYRNAANKIYGDIQQMAQSLGYTGQELNGISWLQFPILNAPAFQHLCFRLGDKVYSVIICLKGSFYTPDSETNFLMPGQGVYQENQIRECEQLDFIPLIAVMDINCTAQTYFVDSKTGDLFELPKAGEFQYKEMTPWEINVIGQDYIMDKLQERGCKIDAYTNVPGMRPSVCYHDGDKNCYLYLVAHPAGVPIGPLSPTNDIPNVTWYFANVEMCVIRGNNGDFKDTSIARGAMVSMSNIEFIPLEEAYEKYGRAEGEAYPLE
jgi:hypothetical protein